MAMDKAALAQRVVGAVVLVSLAVIFLPILLQSGDEKEDVVGSHVPPVPERVSTLVFKRDERGVFQSVGPLAPTAPAEASGGGGPSAGGAPAPSPGDAWMVQLGTFASESAATALREKLRAKHYPTYVEPVRDGASESWRVKVGPEISQATAQALKNKLEKETGLKAFLVKHGS